MLFTHVEDGSFWCGKPLVALFPALRKLREPRLTPPHAEQWIYARRTRSVWPWKHGEAHVVRYMSRMIDGLIQDGVFPLSFAISF
jgi:hypothetical protein